MKLPTILRAIMFGLLAISFVASGQSASLAFGACWIVGATLAVVKGIQAIRTEALKTSINVLNHGVPIQSTQLNQVFVASVVAVGSVLSSCVVLHTEEDVRQSLVAAAWDFVALVTSNTSTNDNQNSTTRTSSRMRPRRVGTRK